MRPVRTASSANALRARTAGGTDEGIGGRTSTSNDLSADIVKSLQSAFTAVQLTGTYISQE